MANISYLDRAVHSNALAHRLSKIGLSVLPKDRVLDHKQKLIIESREGYSRIHQVIAVWATKARDNGFIWITVVSMLVGLACFFDLEGQSMFYRLMWTLGVVIVVWSILGILMDLINLFWIMPRWYLLGRYWQRLPVERFIEDIPRRFQDNIYTVNLHFPHGEAKVFLDHFGSDPFLVVVSGNEEEYIAAWLTGDPTLNSL